jgi:hypothetical protein
VALESRFVHHTWLAITTSRHLPLIVQLVGRQDMSRRRGVTRSCRRSRHPVRPPHSEVVENCLGVRRAFVLIGDVG